MDSGIGHNVKLFRTMAHMTQMELARALGYKNQASIARIENGERDVPLSTVKQMAEILGVNIADLFYNYENSPYFEYIPYLIRMDEADPEKMRIIREMLGMSPKKIYNSSKEIV